MPFLRCHFHGCSCVIALLLALALAASWGLPVSACSSILVTRGASADGSVMISYTCDAPGVYGSLAIRPAADHEPDEMIEVGRLTEKDTSPRGRIPQVAHTYRVMGLMNEHQLAVSESTFEGRPEAENPQGMLGYGELMMLMLERARTAREAIHVFTSLVAQYGYGDVGESISIADPREAWILEIVGSGPGGKGGAWVAVRIPDGQIACHANQARIGEFPRHDPENCLYSDNVESLAVSKGWYDPKSGQPFRFFEAYSPATPVKRRVCDTRVWSVLRRVAPSLHFSPDYHRGLPGSQPYPLSVVPDKKLSPADVFALLRDHYEGTEYDMTQGVDAGPFGSPYRWRPLTWKVDGVQYAWERPFSTQQTGYSFVTQSRAWLPNPIGGLTWYGVDDTYTTCYLPLYCGIDALPKALSTGSLNQFSWDSAWWVFNVVSNYSHTKYSQMMPEVQAAQKDIESELLALQPAVEKTALELATTDPKLMIRYLTDYSVSHAEQTTARWRTLAEYLFTKYRDGYVYNGKGTWKETGYPEAWLRRVVRERPEPFRLPPEEPSEKK